MARLLLAYGADANIRDEVRHFLIETNVSVALRQVSHWHCKRFTPWHAICRATVGKKFWQCAWRCVAMRVRWNSVCDVVARIFKCWKISPMRHDLPRRNCRATFVSLSCTSSVTNFVNSSWLMRDRWHDIVRHGANYASPSRLDRLRVTKMARFGTTYCGELREHKMRANVWLALYY